MTPNETQSFPPEELPADPLEIGLAAAFGASPNEGRTGTHHPAESPGTIIAGKYKLLQQIGEGGMGSVWMADQIEPVKRRVAVKLIRTERGSSKTILSRFEAERQAIALMDHPNIAKLLDAGTTEKSQPYFVMELVKGIPLTDYCDQHKLPIPDRLNLFLQICSAVQHAHQKGIIHRDLKPTNILIESHDGKPVPKVIDFGLAKATSGMQLTENTLFTGFGSVLGTPMYMAPEQANFNAIDVDTRADIYALGVILYELLTGSTPLTRETIKKAQLDEMLKLIREQEAPTPSSRLSTSDAKPTVAANRQTEPIKLGRIVKGELDWIVMKSLSKERERRYETANGFARDVERFLNHEPVVAGPVTARYRFRKWLNRNKVAVLAATIIWCWTLIFVGFATMQWLFARDAENRAKESARVAEVKRFEAEAQKIKAEKAEAATLDSYRASTDDAIEQLIGSKDKLGPQERTYLEKTLKRWQQFAERQGNDTQTRLIRAEGFSRMGNIWIKLGQWDEAQKNYEACLADYVIIVAEHPQVDSHRNVLARAHVNLGSLLNQRGKLTEAERQYRLALDIQIDVVAKHPQNALYLRSLAQIYGGLGTNHSHQHQWVEAERFDRKALAIFEQLTRQNPGNQVLQDRLAITLHNLGTALHHQEKIVDAEKQFRRALLIQLPLTTEHPGRWDYQWALSNIRSNLGLQLKLLGQSREAEEQIRIALSLKEQLVVQFPTIPQYRRDLIITQNQFARLLDERRKWAEAETMFRRAIANLKMETDEWNDLPANRVDLADLHVAMGMMFARQKKREASEEQFLTSLRIQEKLVADFPALTAYRVKLAGINCDFGIVSEGWNPSGGMNYFDRAIQILSPIVALDPNDTKAKKFLRNSHGGRAKALDRAKSYQRAGEDWDRAVALCSKEEQLSFRASRAISRAHAGQVTEAVAEVAELTTSPTATAGQWYNFACVYAVACGKVADKKDEYAKRAVELLQHAVKAGYRDIANLKRDTDLDPLRERDDFKTMLIEMEKK